MVLVGDTDQKEVDVLVDTGFNGYLTVPKLIADTIGMKNTGAVSSSTVADGSTSPSLVYQGKVVYDGSRTDVFVDVQPDCKLLLGMALLEEFGLTLYVDVTAKKVEFNSTGSVARPV